MNQHTISVIIPTYNRADTLVRAIASVVNQQYKAREIIIVDDGSTDDTQAIIKQQYPTINYIQTSQNGVSSARNIGIQAASGEWIALLDSDDEWLPKKLAEQVKILVDNPDHKICHTNEIWIRNGVRVNAMKKHKKTGGHIYRHCLPLCAISPSSVVLHKSIFSDVGYFDETLPACEDYDMWLKVCAKYPVLYLEEPLVKKYGGHSDQLSLAHWGMDRFRIKALTNILESQYLSKNQIRETLEVLHKKCDIFITGAKKRNNTDAAHYYSAVKERYQIT